ncbi:inactive peptidyl-prolyl cis-trans isomerase FKBP6-like [Lineus longissimus]|uniref:inactive peptidyl-prolyl cis-trans isomerase FKBP6-like n=1 Tax=Lineus longissimus TaxID=88925 RepID=UPI002B4D7B99
MSEEALSFEPNVDISEALDKLRELELEDVGASEDESEPGMGNEDGPALDEEPVIRLKAGIDREKLMNADKDGVDFEIIPEGVSKETNTSLGADREYFESEDYKFASAVAVGEDEDDVEEEEYEGLSPFEKHIKKRDMEDITSEKNGKVWKKELQKGSGAVVSDSSLVRVHYSAWCEFADEPFDCTRMQGRPRSLKLGTGDCIVGLDLAISTMRLNEVAEFVIYPEYAYGKFGCPPRVPPSAIIRFQVTLIQCIDHAGVDEYFKMGPKLQQEVPFEQVMRIMRLEREVGNDMYRRKHHIGALRRYRRAARALEDRHLADEAEEEEQKKALLKFFLNIAQCYITMCKWPKVITFSSYALRIDGKKPKAYFKMGKALRKLHEYKRARYFLRKGLQESPNNSDLAKELKLLDQDIKLYTASETEFCRKMFSSAAVVQDKVADAENIPTKDPLLSCVPEFQNGIKRVLAEFIADNDLQEIPFPSSRFNQCELAYIGRIANNMDLVVVYRGEGANLLIKIRKK